MNKYFLLCLVITLTACGQKAEEKTALENSAAMQKGFNDAKPVVVPKLDTSTRTYKKTDNKSDGKASK